LQEQPARVLHELIAHAGRVVTREQLIALLWPKGVVDFDTGLNTVIRKLRVALEDTADTPRYIETLPRRGYRFVGTLDLQPEAFPPVPSAATIDPVSRLPSRSAAEPPLPNDVRPALDPTDTEKSDPSAPRPQPGRLPWRMLLAALAVIGILTPLVMRYRSHGVRPPVVAVTDPSAARAALAPPAHSIAVLPFVNLSS